MWQDAGVQASQGYGAGDGKDEKGMAGKGRGRNPGAEQPDVKGVEFWGRKFAGSSGNPPRIYEGRC